MESGGGSRKLQFLCQQNGGYDTHLTGLLWGVELNLCLAGDWHAPLSQQEELDALTNEHPSVLTHRASEQLPGALCAPRHATHPSLTKLSSSRGELRSDQ